MGTIWMDAHCHLSDSAFDNDREALYAELLANDIHGLVLAGTDPEDWQKQSALTLPAPLRIAKVFGIHPWNVDDMTPTELSRAVDQLEKSLGECHGLGEMGLDYYRAKTTEERAKHKLWFDRQLELAKGRDHPLILHIVKAHHDSIPQLKRHQKSFRGLIHSFWAHPDVARSYIDMGFLLSIPPRIMKEDPHQILKLLDPESLVFETDTPFKNASGDIMKPVLIHPMLEYIAAARGEALDIAVARQARLLSNLFPILKG